MIFKHCFSDIPESLLNFCRYFHCHKIGYQGKKRRDPVGPLNSSTEKLLVTENPVVALDNSSSHVPISNAQGGSEESNLHEKLVIFTSS
jgi:hypothetical protein